MCGIAASLTASGSIPKTSPQDLVAMRDAMAHRGPDGAGLFISGNIALAHRRLAVVETSASGHQPMQSACGRYAIIYNGELYNTAELRRDLASKSITLKSHADTEVLLYALATWGLDAMPRIRGMYAFVFVDLLEQRAIVARDPLGIKPLYWTSLGNELLFASELQGLLAHSKVSAHPNLTAISAYLSTIRTTIGAETLFEGLHTLLPGEWLSIYLSKSTPHIATHDWWSRVADLSSSSPLLDGDRGSIATIRAAIDDSVSRHLVSDVPLCSLLSGGIDSTIIAAQAIAAGNFTRPLSTYCAGHHQGDDFKFARAAAKHFRTQHHEAHITQELFTQRWSEMVQRQGVPLSTPNEVAINQVARFLRSAGNVVALSGEGADELFGGYTQPMSAAAAYFENPQGEPGLFALGEVSWIRTEHKSAILNENVWNALDSDANLKTTYIDEFRRLSLRGTHSGLDTILAMQRRFNLAGLLSRLDSAMMLEGVEGRTPFADQAIATLAESLPMHLKFQPPEKVETSTTGGVAVAQLTRAAQGKIILRQAYADCIPREIIDRPKASFPLPFQEWVAESSPIVKESELCRDLFNEAAIATVAANSTQCWQIAWPMINLAMWSKRWWG